MKWTWLLLGVGGYVAWKMYNAAQSLTYKIKSVSIDGSNTNLLQTAFTITITVTNPTNQGLSFDRFTGSLNFSGQPLANFNVSGVGKDITLAANNDTDISFPVTVQNTTALAAIIDFIKTNTAGNQFEINGQLFVGPFQVPIKEKVGLSGVKRSIGAIGNCSCNIGGLYSLIDY